MRIKLPNSFWLKPLRWAFVQSFGSKSKAEFDQKVEPYIEQVLAKSNGNLNTDTIAGILQQNGVVTELINQVMSDLKIQSSFGPVIGFFVQSWLTDAINAKIGLKSRSKLSVSKLI